jgi:hypothetical protein
MSEETPTPAEIVAAALVDAATAPSSISNETGSVTTRSVNELIALDRYLASKAAVDRADLGLRFSRFSPPGAV